MAVETSLVYKEIGAKLNISPRTVKVYMALAMTYFGVRSRIGIALEWSAHKFHFQTWESYLAWHRRTHARQ